LSRWTGRHVGSLLINRGMGSTGKEGRQRLRESDAEAAIVVFGQSRLPSLLVTANACSCLGCLEELLTTFMRSHPRLVWCLTSSLEWKPYLTCGCRLGNPREHWCPGSPGQGCCIRRTRASRIGDRQQAGDDSPWAAPAPANAVSSLLRARLPSSAGRWLPGPQHSLLLRQPSPPACRRSSSSIVERAAAS
jgi:hypothetical protein